MKLSIITVNYNNKTGLEKTTDSIKAQTSKDFEWIVIDGGSNDGSKELIQQHEDIISYWVSEKDSGVYNAMNKGIKVSTGDYILFLNSGDSFFDNSVVETIHGSSISADFAVFNMLLSFRVGNKLLDLSELEQKPLLYFLFKRTFPHQATLIKRTIFFNYGLYDENYRLVADWHLFFKACIFGNATWKYHKELTLSVYDMNGLSTINSNAVNAERQNYLKEVFSEAMIEGINSGIFWGNVYYSVTNKNRIINFLFRSLLWLSNKTK